MPSDDADWTKRLERAIAAVRLWESSRVEPDEVEPGSSLAGDDQGWPPFPVSTLAWTGLTAAIDHLALLADDLTNESSALRPTAPLTLTRAALLGASQAVWLLAPTSRAERVRRGLLIADDERANHAQFARDYANDSAIDVDAREELTGLVSRLTADREAIRRALGDKTVFRSTVMMKESAAHLFRAEGETDLWARRALSYEWRVASGAAHARLWPMFVRPTEREPIPGGGHIRRLTTSVQEVGQAFGAATLMTAEALRLWDLRRVKHT